MTVLYGKPHYSEARYNEVELYLNVSLKAKHFQLRLSYRCYVVIIKEYELP